MSKPGYSTEPKQPGFNTSTSHSANGGQPLSPAPARPVPPSIDRRNGPNAEIFLSPRVIDREAFNDYSQSLRKMIEQTTAQADAFRAAAKEAEQAQMGLKELLGRQQAAVGVAVKTIATLEDRSGETSRIFNAAKDAVATLDQLRGDSGELIGKHLSRLDQRVEEAVRSFEERLALLEAKMSQSLEERIANVTELAVGKANEAAKTLEDTAASAWERLGDAMQTSETRLEEASRQGMLRIRTDQDATISVIEQTKSGVQTMTADAMSMIRKAAEEATTAVRTARIDTVASAERLEANLVRERTAAADTIARLEDMLGEAEAVIGAAELASDGEAPVLVPGSLGDLLSKIEKSQEQAEAALNDTQTLQERADAIRQGLAEEVEAAAAKADTIAANAQQVGETLEKQVEAATKIMTTREHLDAIASRAAAAKDLGEKALANVSKSVADLSRLLEQLRPWKSVMFEHSPGQPTTLPPALESILDTVRGELSRDLGVIAAGMYQMAMKTHKVTQQLDGLSGGMSTSPR